MRVTSVLFVCVLLFGGVSVASAQTVNRWGLVMGFPASAGLQWQMNDRLTLRSDAAFDWGSVEQVSVSSSVFINGAPVSSTTRTTDFEHSTISLGVSGLITVARREQLRLYVAPRIGWRRLHSTFSSESDVTGAVTIPGLDQSSATTTNGLELAGTFGANYRLGDRFSIFGETGIGFTSPTSSSSSRSDSVTSYIIGSRAGVGAVVHF
jgi:hypothetical protein